MNKYARYLNMLKTLGAPREYRQNIGHIFAQGECYTQPSCIKAFNEATSVLDFMLDWNPAKNEMGLVNNGISVIRRQLYKRGKNAAIFINNSRFIVIASDGSILYNEETSIAGLNTAIEILENYQPMPKRKIILFTNAKSVLGAVALAAEKSNITLLCGDFHYDRNTDVVAELWRRRPELSYAYSFSWNWLKPATFYSNGNSVLSMNFAPAPDISNGAILYALFSIQTDGQNTVRELVRAMGQLNMNLSNL